VNAALFEVQVVKTPVDLSKIGPPEIGRRDVIAAVAAACAAPALILGPSRKTLARQIADDFAAGRVGLVDGWVLAETEIRLLAASPRSERA
jgi:hypothetical protein